MIADAGLPVPKDVEVIDLAVMAGVPRLWDVLAAIQSELVIEAALTANEASDELRAKFAAMLDRWGAETQMDIAHSTVSHTAFKKRSGQARAIVRTGECTPYANIILVSGVPF